MKNCEKDEESVYTVGKTTYKVNVVFGENKDGQLENLITFLIDYLEGRERNGKDER